MSTAAEQHASSEPTPQRGPPQLPPLYIGAVLCPIAGVILATWLAVAQRTAPIRRHAIGLAAAALLSAGIYTAVIVNRTAGHADSSVQSDVSSVIFTKYGVLPDAVACSQQSGSLFSCVVTVQGQSQTVQVTDDGHTVVEQGFAPPPATGAGGLPPDGTPCMVPGGANGEIRGGDCVASASP